MQLNYWPCVTCLRWFWLVMGVNLFPAMPFKLVRSYVHIFKRCIAPSARHHTNPIFSHVLDSHRTHVVAYSLYKIALKTMQKLLGAFAKTYGYLEKLKV